MLNCKGRHYEIKNSAMRELKNGIKKMGTEAENEKTKKGGRGVLYFLNKFKFHILL